MLWNLLSCVLNTSIDKRTSRAHRMIDEGLFTPYEAAWNEVTIKPTQSSLSSLLQLMFTCIIRVQACSVYLLCSSEKRQASLHSIKGSRLTEQVL